MYRVLLPSAYSQNRSLPLQRINTLGLCCEQIQNGSSTLCIISSGSTGVLTVAGNTSPYPLPALASPHPLGDRGAELAMCVTLAQVKATRGYSSPALNPTFIAKSSSAFQLSCCNTCSVKGMGQFGTQGGVLPQCGTHPWGQDTTNTWLAERE